MHNSDFFPLKFTFNSEGPFFKALFTAEFQILRSLEDPILSVGLMALYCDKTWKWKLKNRKEMRLRISFQLVHGLVSMDLWLFAITEPTALTPVTVI